MKKLQYWLCLLVLLLTNCLPSRIPHSENRYVYLTIDKSFTSQEQDGIYSAIKEWNHALNHQLTLVVVDVPTKESISILPVDTSFSGMPKVKEGHFVLGWVSQPDFKNIYLVTSRIKGNDTYFVLLHEIGHALGAKHTEDGLMAPNYSPVSYQCIDRSTLTQISTIWNLNIKKIKYCK